MTSSQFKHARSFKHEPVFRSVPLEAILNHRPILCHAIVVCILPVSDLCWCTVSTVLFIFAEL